jgi:hypothetical protein
MDHCTRALRCGMIMRAISMRFVKAVAPRTAMLAGGTMRSNSTARMHTAAVHSHAAPPCAGIALRWRTPSIKQLPSKCCSMVRARCVSAAAGSGSGWPSQAGPTIEQAGRSPDDQQQQQQQQQQPVHLQSETEDNALPGLVELFTTHGARLTTAAQCVWAQVLQPGDIAVDATCGNGNDALFMAQRIGPAGTLHAVDLQARPLSLPLSLARMQALNDSSVRGNTLPTLPALPTLPMLLLPTRLSTCTAYCC